MFKAEDFEADVTQMLLRKGVKETCGAISRHASAIHAERCPAESDLKCLMTVMRGAEPPLCQNELEAIRFIKSKDAELERLRLALGESEGVRKALEESKLVKAHRELAHEAEIYQRERDRAETENKQLRDLLGEIDDYLTRHDGIANTISTGSILHQRVRALWGKK
jgi:hypothetical protein